MHEKKWTYLNIPEGRNFFKDIGEPCEIDVPKYRTKYVSRS